MANYKGELSPALEYSPGDVVRIAIGEGQHAALDAALSVGGKDAGLNAKDIDIGAPAAARATPPAGPVFSRVNSFNEKNCWAGTIAADVVPGGEYYLTPGYGDGYGELADYWKLPITIKAAAVTISRPDGPAWTDTPPSYTLPNAEGIVWTVDGTEKPAGTYTAEAGTTVTVYAAPAAGYTFGDGDEPSEYVHEFPPAPPEPVTISRPAGPVWDDAAPSYTLPETPGIVWTVAGTDMPAGTYTVEAGSTVTVYAAPAAGYTFGDGDEPSEYVHVFPVPEPEPVPEPDWPTETTAGGDLVARWLRWDTEEERAEAAYYYYVVSTFVEGYTRGRGFNAAGEPTRMLQNVIVSAAARLARNPENISRYSVDSYSETRAVFEGFNMAELGILNNYRRRSA